MKTPLNASASTAGALFSSSTFEVPQFQREYSWQVEEVGEFWSDLQKNLEAESYFLGLVILTEEDERKHVVDGQQRIITLTLLATALYYEALKRDRKALADRVQADFLRSIDYATDDTDPRVRLSDQNDNATLQAILSTGQPPATVGDEGSVSHRMVQSFKYLTQQLTDDLKLNPFRRLGKWTEFLTHHLYFAVFIHPDPGTAYQVYEVINTRGRELTTADLLKNYILSQTKPSEREIYYQRWQFLSAQFDPAGANNFVQYIRHVITVRSGHILPKDLYSFIAQRANFSEKEPPVPNELMNLLEEYLPLYLQMIDPTLAGPADAEALKIFAALNSLGVIAVRPILLAVASVADSLEGMKYVLRLVVRRIVVGNLGTGNVERRFGEAARNVYKSRGWKVLEADLGDLNPTREQFVEQVRKRSFNKGVLAFLRRSILAGTTTPDAPGVLHFIWTQQWADVDEEEMAFWSATIGNTFLSQLDRRPKGAANWEGFKQYLFPTAIGGEWADDLSQVSNWNANAVEQQGDRLAEVAGGVWY